MFICEIWLFDWYFPQFCKSDMSKYGYLEVFQSVSSTLRQRESTVHIGKLKIVFENSIEPDDTAHVEPPHPGLPSTVFKFCG